MHQTQSSYYLIVFICMKDLQDGQLHVYRQCFLLDKSCRKIYIFSMCFPRCYVNRGEVTSWQLLGSSLTASSITCIMKQVPPSKIQCCSLCKLHGPLQFKLLGRLKTYLHVHIACLVRHYTSILSCKVGALECMDMTRVPGWSKFNEHHLCCM
jgi:hypothetical protein